LLGWASFVRMTAPLTRPPCGVRRARALTAGLLVVLAACVWGQGPEPAGRAASGPGAERNDGGSAATEAVYRLDSGDKLRVIVFGEHDLSGEFEVDGTGTVSLPLIGQVYARGLTLRGFEAAVEALLSDGYLKDPRVSTEVLNYRPFYIIGEVQEGGEYPFVSGMNVLTAVALAGGYTYRANSSRVYITRESHELELPATADTRVLPGDVIRVPERFF
jgi:polysaccharide export outer membrane protein